MNTFLKSIAVACVAVLFTACGGSSSSSTPDTNNPPIANAGHDQNVHTGSTVQLDGSGSYDPDGDLITYSWSIISKPDGSNAELSGVTLASATVSNPIFVADVDGTYVVQLIVNDGQVNSAPDTVTIIASTGNAAPIANAGADQNVETGDLVGLDGSGSSDADGDILTYEWGFVSRPAGSSATLSDITIVNPTFIADIDGSYVVQLIVNDDTVSSTPDTVTITASTINSAPVADAGTDQDVDIGSTVTLDGSGSSDADGDDLTYSWLFVSKPPSSTATLSEPTAVNPTFIADIGGAYVIQLIVNDGTIDSAIDTVTVNANNLVTHVSNTFELRQALLDAAQNGANDKIILADGVYKTTDDGGGTFIFLGNEPFSLTLQGSDSSNVILSGDHTHQIFNYQSTSDTHLVLNNLSFVDADTPVSASSSSGGAVYVDYSLEINNCIFSNNYSGWQGGAIRSHSYADLIINNSAFIGNSSYQEGGAIYGGYAIVNNTIIRNNSARLNSGGLFVSGLTMVNSIVDGNSASTYDAMRVWYRTTYIYNSIIINNNQSGLFSIALDNRDDHLIQNTTFTNNADKGEFICWEDPCIATINYSYIDENKIYVPYFSTGNIYTGVELGFVDQVNGNYRLTNTSDLIDSGSSGGITVLETDLDGNTRIIGNNIDIGPYEYQ